jgi:hypothetical protein
MLKSENNNRHFTWRPTCFYAWISDWWGTLSRRISWPFTKIKGWGILISRIPRYSHRSVVRLWRRRQKFYDLRMYPNLIPFLHDTKKVRSFVKTQIHIWEVPGSSLCFWFANLADNPFLYSISPCESTIVQVYLKIGHERFILHRIAFNVSTERLARLLRSREVPG